MDPVTGLSLGRIGVGVVAFADPALACRLLSLDPESSPQLPFVTRLFGIREIALGAITLAARDTTRRNLVLAGIAVDAADGLASVIGVRRHEVPKRSGLALLAPAAGAVGAGVAALRGSRR